MAVTEASNRTTTRWIVPAGITVLALLDGLIHFSLDYILFKGRLIGSPFPAPPPSPPGGASAHPAGPPPPPFPLPLNELFLLNAAGYIGLVGLYWIVFAVQPGLRWLVDVVMIVYAALSIVGWVAVGMPNPHGLGYLSKVVEVALIVLLAVDALAVLRPKAVAQGTLSRRKTAI
jgi:hypothetical protein